MELREIFAALLKWWKLIVVCVVVAAIFSYVASVTTTPLYRTTTTLQVGSATTDPNINQGELFVGQQLALTYIELAKRRSVLQGAIDSLGLQMSWDQLTGRVNPSIVPQTQLIEISVVDNDPRRAKALADAISEQLILQSPAANAAANVEEIAFAEEQLADLKTKIDTSQEQVLALQLELDDAIGAREIQELEQEIAILNGKITGWQETYAELLTFLQGGDINTISIVDLADVPARPFSPNVTSNVATAALIGLTLAVGAAFLIEYLDDSIRTSDDVLEILDKPILSYVPEYEGTVGLVKDRVYTREFPHSPVAEAFRLLRANLEFEGANEAVRTIMVTSPGASEGKTEVAINLAAVVAHSSNPVTLIDADLRSPSLHHRLDISNEYGLSDLVLRPLQRQSAAAVWQGDQHLAVIPSGTTHPNPTEVFLSEEMDQLIADAQKEDHFTIFDGSPLFLADAQILSAKVDGVLLVVRPGFTKTNSAKGAMEQLNRAGANILGVVMTRVPRSFSLYDGYYYSGEYPSPSASANGKAQETQPLAERLAERIQGRFGNRT